jgi:hypothetical protein
MHSIAIFRVIWAVPLEAWVGWDCLYFRSAADYRSVYEPYPRVRSSPFTGVGFFSLPGAVQILE